MKESEIFAYADALLESGRNYENIFNELKLQTGLSKTKLKTLFKTRLSDEVIVELLMNTPPDMPIGEKCREIKRLTLGEINSAGCLRVLFRVLEAHTTAPQGNNQTGGTHNAKNTKN